MPELSVSTLLLFAAFVVPGAVSLRFYTLKVSVVERPLKDSLIEAVVFSVVNFALLYWLIIYGISEETLSSHPVQSYFMLVFTLFVAPAFWPFAMLWVLRTMEKWRWINPQAKTAWDHYFNKLRRGSYIIVHLNNGAFIGGKFDRLSYASGYPDSGHLFLEELWEVGPDGNFTGVVFEGQGVLLRPTDYKYIRVST